MASTRRSSSWTGQGRPRARALLDFRTRAVRPGPPRARPRAQGGAGATELLRVHFRLGEEFARAALDADRRGPGDRAGGPPDRLPRPDGAPPSAGRGAGRARRHPAAGRAGDHRGAHRTARRGGLPAARRRRGRRGRAARAAGGLAPVPPGRGHPRLSEPGRHRQRDASSPSGSRRSGRSTWARRTCRSTWSSTPGPRGAETFDRDGARAAAGRVDPGAGRRSCSATRSWRCRLPSPPAARRSATSS